jgi:hypothetical protein
MNFKKILIRLFLCFKIGAPNNSVPLGLSNYLPLDLLKIVQSTQGLEPIKAEARRLLKELGSDLAPGCAGFVLESLAKELPSEFDEVMKEGFDAVRLKKILNTTLSPERLKPFRAACCKAATTEFLEDVLKAPTLEQLFSIGDIRREYYTSSKREYEEKAELVTDYMAGEIVAKVYGKGRAYSGLTEKATLLLNVYCTLTELDNMYECLPRLRKAPCPFSLGGLHYLPIICSELGEDVFYNLIKPLPVKDIGKLDLSVPDGFTYVKQEYLEAIISALEAEGLDPTTRKVISLGMYAIEEDYFLGEYGENPHRAIEHRKKAAMAEQDKEDLIIQTRRSNLITIRKKYVSNVARKILSEKNELTCELFSNKVGLIFPLSPIDAGGLQNWEELKVIIGNLNVGVHTAGPSSLLQNYYRIVRDTLPYLEKIKTIWNAEFLADCKKEAQLKITRAFLEKFLNSDPEVSPGQLASESEALIKYAENELAIKCDDLRVKVISKITCNTFNSPLDLEEKASSFVDDMLVVLTANTISSNLIVDDMRFVLEVNKMASNLITRFKKEGYMQHNPYAGEHDEVLDYNRYGYGGRHDEVLDKLKDLDAQLRRIMNKVIPGMYETLLPLTKSGCGIEASALKKISEAYEKAGFNSELPAHQIQQLLISDMI